MKIVLIPARKGSKGIPRKNIIEIWGKPLISHTIESAIKSEQFDRVVVSTDSEEIAEISRSAGAEIPFLRPQHLATDKAKGNDVVSHCLEQISGVSKICLLQPTSPIRSPLHIKQSLEMLENFGASACVSVTANKKSPYWMYTIEQNGVMQPLIKDKLNQSQRQAQPQTYYLNGSIFWSTSEAFLKHSTFVHEDTIGFIMDEKYSLDIDTMEDLEHAQTLYQANPIITPHVTTKV